MSSLPDNKNFLLAAQKQLLELPLGVYFIIIKEHILEETSLVIISILVFAFLSLFFSANSLALKAISRFKLQEALKEDGKESLLDEIMQRSERLQLSCRFFQLLSNIILFLLIFAFNEQRYNAQLSFGVYGWTFLAAVVVFSLVSLALPHAWAKYRGDKLVGKTYKLLLFFKYVTTPILLLFGFYDNIIRRLAGVAEMSEEETQEEKHDEFLSTVEQSKADGVVDDEELEMIENVLDLSETTAGEIITPRTEVIALEINSSLDLVLSTITKAGHSRIPVYEDTIDKIVGLVYAKDLLSEVGRENKGFKLKDIIREAYFVPETKPLRILLHEFQTKKQHIAVVLDEYGGTAGIVTIEDILEELVGEITDEYEKNPPASIRKLNDKTIEMESKIYIDDLNSDYDFDLPEDEDYDTVGGFVFSHLGYIPKTGETFTYNNLRFTISSAEARKIKRIRVEKISDTDKNNQ